VDPVVDGLPRGTSRELLNLLGQLWPGQRSGESTVTAGVPAAGWRSIEEYLVVPGLARAQMLLPADPLVAARSLGHYNALRERRSRISRLAVAGALRVPGAGRRLFEVITICAPIETTPARVTELSLAHWIAQRLGRRRLSAAIGLTNPGPNRKPVLQLFDAAGRPAAFVKVGWNDLTRAMVDNEAATLRALHCDGTTYPLRPRVLLHEAWQGMSILVTGPLPLDVRAHPSAPAPAGACHRHGPGVDATVLVRPLAASGYWRQVLARVDEVTSAGRLLPGEALLLRQHVEGIETSYADRKVAFGRWHGDWVHWNMARQGDQLWVWDWEHAAIQAPVGFDAMHFTFQREFVRRHRSFAAAVTTAGREARDVPGHRQRPEAADLVADTLYPLEIYLRAARMHVLGAGWNPRLHEGAVEWISTRR